MIITGQVQGVGFRPHVCREATKRGLKGYIKNNEQGVAIVVDNESLLREILQSLPPQARIKEINSQEVNDDEKIYNDFKILPSAAKNENGKIPPDIACCDICLEELFDSKNRRNKYHFISCTDCGPRYSIAKNLPFDRENTSLVEFPLCPDCQHEYNDPQSRRFHAQTIACKTCGPTLKFWSEGVMVAEKEEALEAAQRVLKENKIIALKSTGGYTLLGNANPLAIKKLRSLIHRPQKPLALMAKDIKMVKQYAEVNSVEEVQLARQERPIVLLKKISRKEHPEISENNRIGFQLPSTPLHHLLFENFNSPLVVTSSNNPGHPITKEREKQFVQYILDDDRTILHTTDDSIVKVIANRPLLIRRSRGWTPTEIPLPSHYQGFNGDLLALGGEKKSVFAIKKEQSLLLSPNQGNTGNQENLRAYQDRLKEFLAYTNAKPKAILGDLNPHYSTHQTGVALANEKEIPFVPIQHHVAHGYSVALEHNLTDFISLVADGSGWGEDETVWGGEVFHQDKRIGHLESHSLIGGDQANREPVRVLVSILSKFLSRNQINELIGLDPALWLKQESEGFNTIKTSSAGRVIDAVAILFGVLDENQYEGQGAQQLESVAEEIGRGKLLPQIQRNQDQAILQTTPLIQYIYERRDDPNKKEQAQEVFHYLAEGLFQIGKNHSQTLPIVWSGGCALNEMMTAHLMGNGVRISQKYCSNDEGISAGQIAYGVSKKPSTINE